MSYYLATNETDVFHYGELKAVQTIETGQPELFMFDTRQELITKLSSYGQQYIDPDIDIIK